ncbi:type II secretion system protein GspL [Kangiella sp. TOML190]|uniref:type II secretion system protein GspL n=1 Tax=Kangiella sp. TOML190 TaxID=2931351 RepID=UPI00203DFA7F|nr:type II secretion system protein GspL [Kangiella sp. TOML190]
MKDSLLIRLAADQESVEWGLINQQEATPKFLERGNLLLDDLVALAEVAADNPVVVLVPAEKVRNFEVEAPTKNRKHLEKAIPYVLEEQIIENVESQHFAIGAVQTNSKVTVNVISKQYLQNLLEKFAQAEIEPDRMMADAAALPVFDDAWSLLDGEPVLVRQDMSTFWSADKSMVADLLQWNLNEKIEQEQVISQAIRVFSASEQAISLETLSGIAVQPMPLDDELLWLAGQNLTDSINLLQQEFTPNKKSSAGLGVWKLPLIAASVALIVGAVYFFSQVFTLNSEKQYYTEMAMAEVKKISPNINEDRLNSKIIEINGLYRNLGSAGQSAGFVNLLDKVYKKLDPTKVKLEQLEYNAKLGTLNLDVRAKDYQVLTASQQELEQSGLQVDMKNARENGANWNTRLVIKLN